MQMYEFNCDRGKLKNIYYKIFLNKEVDHFNNHCDFKKITILP